MFIYLTSVQFRIFSYCFLLTRNVLSNFNSRYCSYFPNGVTQCLKRPIKFTASQKLIPKDRKCSQVQFYETILPNPKSVK